MSFVLISDTCAPSVAIKWIQLSVARFITCFKSFLKCFLLLLVAPKIEASRLKMVPIFEFQLKQKLNMLAIFIFMPYNDTYSI